MTSSFLAFGSFKNETPIHIIFKIRVAASRWAPRKAYLNPNFKINLPRRRYRHIRENLNLQNEWKIWALELEIAYTNASFSTPTGNRAIRMPNSELQWIFWLLDLPAHSGRKLAWSDCAVSFVSIRLTVNQTVGFVFPHKWVTDYSSKSRGVDKKFLQMHWLKFQQ